MNILAGAFNAMVHRPFAPLRMGELNLVTKRFASKKQGGKTKNGRDSNPKYRGFKKGSQQEVSPGNIILRQKGTKWHPGEGVGMGKDFTIYAKKAGFVNLERKYLKKITVYSKGQPIHKERKYIHVVDTRKEPPVQDLR